MDVKMSINSSLNDFKIGHFGDIRRQSVGEDLFRAVNEKGTLIIQRLAKDRSEQVRFSRFLWNDTVTFDEIKNEALSKTKLAAKGCPHVLCFQDTTEIDLSKRKDDIDITSIGLLKNRDESGFYFHPVLAMDERDNFIFGLSSIHEFDYDRPRKKVKGHIAARKPVEEKKSFRWIQCAQETNKTLSDAGMVTIIGDRENDFFEFFDRVPKDNLHVLVRCKGERRASKKTASAVDAVGIFNLMEEYEVQDTKILEVPFRAAIKIGFKENRRAARQERKALLKLKYGVCTLHAPKELGRKMTSVSFIEVKEDCSSLIDGEEPISWLLLTSHEIKNVEEAWRMVGWYKKRWHIEQLFRTAKKGGMQLETVELSKGAAIKKLCLLGLLASVRILQLTLCRDNKIVRKANEIFSQIEVNILHVMQTRYEGKTAKQKNPYPKYTMAWAAWILGRMGGWKGYIQSEGPAGPTTFKRGIDQLHNLLYGFHMLKDVCIT